MSLQIGDAVPLFSLPATDGIEHSPPARGEAAATVIVFTCNHCPYALAWEDRLLDVGRDYVEKGVSMLAINPNDAERKPADSFEAMKARLAETPWPIAYLRDEDQTVAAAFDAKTTPDVFLFDGEGKLAYRGAPDADYHDPSLKAEWLRAAIDAVLGATTPNPAQTEPVGCSIKWR